MNDIRKVERFLAPDGTEHASEQDARDHMRIMHKLKQNCDGFIQEYTRNSGMTLSPEALLGIVKAWETYCVAREAKPARKGR